jgi:hypothetical protein
MKTVVEVTDMKTVQKLANIVRLWKDSLESLYLVCADPSQTAEIAKHAERAGLVSENGCWCRKTGMLVSENGNVGETVTWNCM